MGIRFACPNGHRLHVKAFLAGQRGICPECDARFIVPAEGGGQAQPVATATIATAEQKAESTETASPPTTAPPLPESELSLPDVWYVRSTGGQYGPADTDTMRTWAAEGRVTHDSWVWRTGWPDWKKGDEALALLNPPVSSAPAPAVEPQMNAAKPIDIAVPALPRTRRSQRRDRARTITIALSAFVLLLLVALVLVLIR